jgi:hypothetical protein
MTPTSAFPILMVDPLHSPQAEAVFLRAAEVVFWEAHALGSAAALGTGGDRGGSHAVNHLTSALLRHFIVTRRFGQAETFFSKFRPNDPSVAMLIARAAFHDQQCNAPRVLGLLAALIIRHRKTAGQVLMIEQSRILRTAGQNAAATMVAEASLHTEGDGGNANAALINLVECYTDAKDGYGARFQTGFYTRRCHWIPRMFA